MTNTYSAGDEIESWCTKCRLELEHTIIAMIDGLPKRVKCNTCGSEHNFKGRPAERKPTAGSTSPGKRDNRGKAYKDYLALLTETDRSSAKPYSPKGSFRENDVIEHSKFGTGLVQSVVKENKIEVIFRDGPRLLVHNME